MVTYQNLTVSSMCQVKEVKKALSGFVNARVRSMTAGRIRDLWSMAAGRIRDLSVVMLCKQQRLLSRLHNCLVFFWEVYTSCLSRLFCGRSTLVFGGTLVTLGRVFLIRHLRS